jgi:hypothetical protein
MENTKQQIEINLPEASGVENEATTRFTHAGKEYILFVALKQDGDPVNPRWSFDEAAFLVCGHRQFTVDGPYHETATEIHRDKGEWEKRYHVYPVYACIDTGVRLKLETEAGFPDRQWDVSTCGYCLISRDESNIPEPLKLAERMVEDLNHYRSGDVWGYDIALYELQTDPGGNAFEDRAYYEYHSKALFGHSIWGYYGSEYALQAAKSIAESIINGPNKRTAETKEFARVTKAGSEAQ